MMGGQKRIFFDRYRAHFRARAVSVGARRFFWTGGSILTMVGCESLFERPDLRAYFGLAAKSLNERAVLLLVLTSAMWGANGVVSRAAVGAIPPMTMVTLRWLIVCALLLPLVREPFLKYAPELRRHWRFLSVMALSGFTGFNVLFYLAGYWTSAVNITLLQGSIPPFVLAGAVLFAKEKVAPRQVAGMAVSFAGVGVIATRGDLAHIGDLSFNLGDLMMLAACAMYAGYTIALRNRPHLPPLVFFAGMAVAAFAASLPFLAGELAMGRAYWPTPKGWALVAFVALAPSLVSQLFFMRAVELIGPGRAGVFSNLTPLFGAFFAIILLGEPFHPYHAAAMALGLSGIALAESAKRSRPP
jgi:drug/metabolite transporter (DMT)-like permease